MQTSDNVFKRFFASGAAGGVLLLVCVICSLFIANSAWEDGYENILETQIGFEGRLRYSILQWINDGLMAIFFLLVGLEIKREMIEGELSSPKRALLPVFAAFGGAILPAIIYASFNANSVTARGWGIPMATDIAFALGALSLLGKKVPASLKIFLAALAIVDDLIAIVVIAVFYSAKIRLDMLSYAGAVFLLMMFLNRLNVTRLVLYILPGLLLWYFVHHSGIHATIAGVLMAVTIPTKKRTDLSPLEKLEHFLTTPVNFIIMPVFALANTNIRFEEGMTSGLIGNLGMGILIGLFLGKPIGIGITSWIFVKFGWGKLPYKATWAHLIGLGLLGGIGFTMSIFIALLSFNDIKLQTEAKFAILIASCISGICGFIVLKLVKRA
jgi:NhaA family Na+:H+ antiporter